jgi:hypothetical protein
VIIRRRGSGEFIPSPGLSEDTAELLYREPGKWFFLLAFLLSCFFFWWLRSILFRLVLHIPDSVDDSTLAVSLLAAACFAIGYLFPAKKRASPALSGRALEACGCFAYYATWIISVPALILSLVRLQGAAAVRTQGYVDSVPWQYQVVLYSHLFFGFMYLGSAQPEKAGFRRLWSVVLLLTIPRLFVSLQGGRFYLAQAVVPIILISIARGWIRLSLVRILQLFTIAGFIVLVPAVTRGDSILGPGSDLQLVTQSDILGLYQENANINLNGHCPPLLISLTAKTIPYGQLGICVMDIGGLKNLPATLERILTFNNPLSFQGLASGTGSNYLLELHISGGLAAVYFGSVLFGFTCRRFMQWSGSRSLFVGIWVECLTRALLSPRGNLGYVFERIPSVALATLAVIFIVWAGHLLIKEHAPLPPAETPA